VEIDEFLQYFMLRMRMVSDEMFHKCCESVCANMEASKSAKQKHLDEAQKFLDDTEEEEAKLKVAKAEAEAKAKAEEEAKAADEAKSAEKVEANAVKAAATAKSSESWVALGKLADSEESREKWLEQLFKDCDIDNSGGLDADEFFVIGQMFHDDKEKEYTKEMNESAFQALDTSGDGIVQIDEFTQFYLLTQQTTQWTEFCERCHRIMATFNQE